MTTNNKLSGHEIWDEIDNYRAQVGPVAAVLTQANLTMMICELHDADKAHVSEHVRQWLEHNQ